MDARDVLLIDHTVRRCAVEKCAATAGDVEFARNQIVPDRFQRREQCLVAGFCINVGGAGVEIGRAHCVSVSDGLFSEGHTILIVVVPFGDEIAHIQQPDRQIEIAPLICFAIQLDQAHQVRRTDSVSCHLRRRIRKNAAQKIGGFSGELQQIRLPRRPMMHAGRGHQMAHVVHLKIHGIAEARRLLAGVLGDLHIGVDVPVGFLCCGDEIDERIKLRVERFIARRAENRCGAFEPFVEVAVVPFRPAMLSFDFAAGDFEVADVSQPIGFGHQPAHRRHHHIATKCESIGPESVRPANVAQTDGVKLREWSERR